MYGNTFFFLFLILVHVMSCPSSFKDYVSARPCCIVSISLCLSSYFLGHIMWTMIVDLEHDAKLFMGQDRAGYSSDSDPTQKATTPT